ncbi:MAG: M18 family aminopeptidase [Peptoniphilus sp.]|nr:M18 family aminopeptidase [Peptoniphilus sp.]
MRDKNISEGLLSFIDDSPCSYFAVNQMKRMLEAEGFKEYKLSDKFNLKVGDRGYFTVNDSSILAFDIGDADIEEKGFRIIASHCDSPGFRIKSDPVIKKDGVVYLNTEVYGGPIYSTWLDRVLSFAGRAVLKSDDLLEPVSVLVNIDRDLLTIPNLAIHMNKEVNKGFVYDAQKHLLPFIALDDEVGDDFIEELIAQELGVDKEDILDFDLYLYDRERAKRIGAKGEFISAGRQDNLAMAYSSLMAMMDSKAKSLNVFLCTDNEEVGSKSIQGADSPMARDCLKKISMALGKGEDEFIRSMENSYIISGDMAHAVHPEYADRADLTNRPILGKGPVIKYAASKSYTTDAYSAAIFMQLCNKAGVEYQKFYNRSGSAGGGTIGPLNTKYLKIKSVDIGNPLIAMHSIRELGAVKDLESVYKVFAELYRS